MPEARRASVRRGVPPLLVAASLLAAACSPDKVFEPGAEAANNFPAVSGTWAYTAREIRLAGTGGAAPCEITGLTLEINQFRHKGKRVGDFDGRSSGGTLTCRGDLAFMSGALQPYRVWEGYALNHDIAFNVGTVDWRHWGFVEGDSMSGQFWLKQGTLQFEGKFVATRTAQ